MSRTSRSGVSENAVRNLFQHPIERGRPVSTGILTPSSHVEISGTRKIPGKTQLPTKNWHSQPNLG